MVICERQKLLYLAPPKTGSISIVKALTTPEFGGYVFDNKANHHNTVWEDRFKDWFIFITARHPYTKAVSFWRFACNQAMNRRRNETRTPFSVFAALILAAAALWKREEIGRLLAVNSLFEADKIVQNFSQMDQLFLTRPLSRGEGPVSPLPKGPEATLAPEVQAWIKDRSVKRRQPNYCCNGGLSGTDKKFRWSQENHRCR